MKTCLSFVLLICVTFRAFGNGTFRIVNSSDNTITITEFYKDTYQNGVLYARTAKSDTTIGPNSSLTWNDTAVSGAYANGFEFHYQCSLTAQGDTIVTPYCTADGQTISETLNCALIECTTNVTLTVYNDSSTMFGQVTWVKDGEVVATDLVSPLTHDDHTFAGLPCNYSGNITATIAYPNNQPYNPFSTNSDIPPTISQTNQWTGTAPTNWVFGWNPSDPNSGLLPPTNGIIWAPSDGTLAQDATLKSVGGTLHDDMQKQISLMNGMLDKLTGLPFSSNYNGATTYTITNINTVSVSNFNTASFTNLISLDGLTNSINAQTFAVTNALGNIEVYTRSNSDASWQLVRTMTNVVDSLSNLVSVFPTNGFTATNIATEQTLEGMSNLLSSISTNRFATNLATESTLQGMSNELAAFHRDVTNALPTNSFDYATSKLSSEIPATATNSSAATSYITSLFAAPLSYLQDAIDGLTIQPDIGSDPGHTSAWEINFCGRLVDFDPVDNFPSVFTWSIGVWDFILVAAYLWSVGQLYLKTIQIYATAQTGGVPNMDVFGGLQALTFGGMFGGNFIGVGVAVIVVGLIVAAWVVVVTVVVVPLGEFIGIYQAISSLFSSVRGTSSGQAGLHLLFSFFPVALAIRLVTARIVLQFTMSKALLVAVGVTRMLFGK